MNALLLIAISCGGGGAIHSVSPPVPPFGVDMNERNKTAIVIMLTLVIASSIIVFDSEENEAVNVTTSDDFIDKVANSTSTFIDLTQDITLSGNCEINRTLTIDLNNYNIEFSSGGFIVNSSLTIKDDKAEGEPVINQDNALTYDSGVISSQGTTITVTEKGILTISDGTVKSTGGCAILNESKVTTKTWPTAPVAPITATLIFLFSIASSSSDIIR